MGAFEGRSVIVSGGARGMGEAEVRLFAAEGAAVVAGDVLTGEGRALAASVEGVTFVRLDVRSVDDWARAVAAAEAQAPLGVLVNNAGIHRQVPITEETPESFEELVAVNLTGAFLGIKAVIEPMRRAGGGAIVNISSTAGMVGMPGRAGYCASKWGLRGLTRSAAIDLGGHGIRVNSVHPGPIATSMMSRGGSFEGVPLGRSGEVEEVARMVLFLAGDGGSYVSGAEVTVDGGMIAGGPARR